jgi:predicted lipoprotein with Yx(FWY)xxD motif
MKAKLLTAAGAAICVVATAALPAHAVMAGERVVAHSSAYGRVIFTAQSRSIYLFTRDRGTSTCYGACAKAWPPVLTKARPVAGHGVNRRLLGTIRRSDGTMQITYAGHPLYRFIGDRRPFQITCQNVSEFGGKWLVVTPAGEPVR